MIKIECEYDKKKEKGANSTMQKGSSTKNDIMSIRIGEDDRANIEKIRRYWFENSGVLYSASEIIRLLLSAVAGGIDVEKGGNENG